MLIKRWLTHPTVFLSVIISFSLAKASEEEFLKNLNIEITAAEDNGDTKKLETVLSQKLVFRRASGAVVDRDQFLAQVKVRPKTNTEIESIKLFGHDRAIVTCIVTMKVKDKVERYHNLRMFIRETNQWKLLAWANEKLDTIK